MIDYNWIPLSNVNMGLDVSRYQVISEKSVINPEAIASNPNIKFVIVRTSISWGYKDPTRMTIWSAMLKAKKLRAEKYPQYDPLVLGTYHVIYPGQSVDAQSKNYLDAMKDLEEVQVLAIDLERILNQTPARIQKDVEELYKDLLFLDLPILLYTRNSFLYTYVFPFQSKVSDIFSKMPGWFAHYGPGGVPRNDYPTVTYTNMNVIIHQFTEQGNAKEYGFDGNRIDENRILIAKDEFYKLMKVTQEAPPEVELTLESLNARLKIVEQKLGL